MPLSTISAASEAKGFLVCLMATPGSMQQSGVDSTFMRWVGSRCWDDSLSDSLITLQYLLDSLINNSGEPVPDLFNQTYHSVDEKLAILAEEQGSSSGCTAVTVFLRLEDEEGNPVAHAKTGGIDRNSRPEVKSGGAAAATATDSTTTTTTDASEKDTAKPTVSPQESTSEKASSGGGLLSNIAKKLKHSPHGSESSPDGGSPSGKGDGSAQANLDEDGLMQVHGKEVKRVLYTANVGDARAVLW
jgi:protein phosphatase PTC1